MQGEEGDSLAFMQEFEIWPYKQVYVQPRIHPGE